MVPMRFQRFHCRVYSTVQDSQMSMPPSAFVSLALRSSSGFLLLSLPPGTFQVSTVFVCVCVCVFVELSCVQEGTHLTQKIKFRLNPDTI